MKIGIITFHWATNYGAVLQAYALQNYLSNIGHDVVIINYKPLKFDYSLLNILTSRSILSPLIVIKNIQKERVLEKFRQNYLYLTQRYKSILELKKDPPHCDVYISGSDQVLNPSFTLYGEDRRSPSSTYYLDFGESTIRKIGYAVSFGCTKYPEKAKSIAKPLLENFNYIGVRENTGINILNDMNYTKTCVVPDPTLLLGRKDYDKLIQNPKVHKDTCYMYMLRTKKSVLKRIKHEFTNIIISESKSEYSILSWLSNLKNAKFVITNSFHGVVFCLHYHIPFVVLLESIELEGMNDRFYTLLEPMGLTNHIILQSNVTKIKDVIEEKIMWNIVDLEIEKLRKIGESFIANHLA